MGFFDFVDEVKERNARKRKINQYLKEARDFIYDGKVLYEESRHMAEDYAEQIRKMLTKHANYKKEVFQNYTNQVQPTLERFVSFQVESRIPKVEMVGFTGVNSLQDSLKLAQASMSIVSLPKIAILDLIEFFSTDEDYYKAIEQRNQAKYFYYDMQVQQQRLGAIKDRLFTIQQHMDEERSVIDSIFDKIQQITRKLMKGMDKESFSQAEAKYLTEIYKIAKALSLFLSSKFLDDDLEITAEYQRNFNLIKTVDQMLRQAPEIGVEDNRWQDWIGQMNQCLESCRK